MTLSQFQNEVHATQEILKSSILMLLGIQSELFVLYAFSANLGPEWAVFYQTPVDLILDFFDGIF